jgi:hypothetical protein
MRRYIWLVQIFVLAAPGRIATTATITTAFQTLEAAAAARHAATATSNDAPQNSKDYEATNDDDGNDRPPAELLARKIQSRLEHDSRD